MATTFSLPLSGVVLSHVIDAFDLRHWDHDDVLSTRNGTAVRFLAGVRVGEEAESKIWRATAAALVESGIVPPVLTLGAPLPPAAAELLAKVPPSEFVAHFLERLAGHWDEMIGGLHRQSPPVFSQRLARVGCLQLVVIDLAVRLTGLLWLTRSEIEDPPPIPWAQEHGMRTWLRELQTKAGISRDKIADGAHVHRHTVDGWLDDDVRPNDENLQDLTSLLAGSGVGEQERLLRELRRAYGLRDLYQLIVEVAGQEHADGLAVRLVAYAVWMLDLAKRSEKTLPEKDMKMHLALTLGTLGRDETDLPFVSSMLNSVWQVEVDPVWRTSIKAATRAWFDRLQEVAAKLPPTAEEEFRLALGEVPPVEEQESIGYLALASKEEFARNPAMRAVMDSEIAEGGSFAALELKLRACEASNRGDLLRAIDLHREALRHDPCNREIHFRLGCCLWQVGDVDAGLAELEIAVQFDPGWDRAQVEIAIVLLNQDQNEEAARRLQAAKPLLRAPSAWLLLHLGFANERVGDVGSAIKTYEELLALDADHAEALDRLAHLYFVRGAKRKGADLAKKAAHLGFTDVFVAWNAGYYRGKKAPGRPPRTTPDHLAQLGDNTWLKPRAR